MFLTKPSFRLEIIIRLGCLTSLPLNHLLKVFALPEDKAIVCFRAQEEEIKRKILFCFFNGSRLKDTYAVFVLVPL